MAKTCRSDILKLAGLLHRTLVSTILLPGACQLARQVQRAVRCQAPLFPAGLFRTVTKLIAGRLGYESDTDRLPRSICGGLVKELELVAHAFTVLVFSRHGSTIGTLIDEYKEAECDDDHTEEGPKDVPKPHHLRRVSCTLTVALTGERPASLFRLSQRQRSSSSGAAYCYTAVTNLARRGRRLVYRQYLPRECLLTKRRS